jgi:hypothetical protein
MALVPMALALKPSLRKRQGQKLQEPKPRLGW